MKENLSTELRAFKCRLRELAERFPKDYYAVFGGTKFVNAFPSYGDALRAGYQSFGRRKFLVRQIGAREESVVSFSEE